MYLPVSLPETITAPLTAAIRTRWPHATESKRKALVMVDGESAAPALCWNLVLRQRFGFYENISLMLGTPSAVMQEDTSVSVTFGETYLWYESGQYKSGAFRDIHTRKRGKGFAIQLLLQPEAFFQKVEDLLAEAAKARAA